MRIAGTLAQVEAGFPRPQNHMSHAAGIAARVVAGSGFGAALPAEIAFLTAYGVEPGILLAAAAQARSQNVSAEAVLLGEGWLEEAAYYRALALHCRAGWLEEPVRLKSSVRFPQAVHAGAAEIATHTGTRWLLAPRGKAIARLIAASRHLPPNEPKPFAITFPQHLSALVQAHSRRERMAAASYGLAKAHPALSAFSPGANFSAQILLVMIGFAVAMAAWSPLVSQLAALTCGVLFSIGIFARLCAMISTPAPVAAAVEAIPDAALPIYTIVVPLYEEARIIPELVAALDRLDYPKSRLDIKLVVEEGDQATQDAIRTERLPARYEMVVAPEGRPRTKPRALNMALPLARGQLLVVFDAEDRPDPLQLRHAVGQFASHPASACLQARLAIDNPGESWLTRLFALEYAALFDVLDPGLCHLGPPLPLGGTSNHFQTRILREIGGWDAWNVTEDADLGLRLARLGHEVRCFNSTTHEEAPITLKAWLGQRRRWQKGWLQTIGTHLSDPAGFVRHLGFFRAVMSAGLIGGMALGTLLGPVFVVALWRSVQDEHLLEPQGFAQIAISTCAVLLLVAGLASTTVSAMLGMSRRGLWHLAPWLLLLPVYQLLCTIAAWQGLLELCRKPFHWEKTAHGVSRMRERR